MTAAYTAYRAHMISCPICGPGPRFCEEGARLGYEAECEHRELDTIASMCWEPLIEYPTDEQMDADYARWEASQKGKL